MTGFNWEYKEEKFLSVVVAGKIDDDDFVEADDKTCCGRWWWYWKPTYQKEHLGWKVLFLCFLLSYTDYTIRQRNTQ